MKRKRPAKQAGLFAFFKVVRRIYSVGLKRGQFHHWLPDEVALQQVDAELFQAMSYVNLGDALGNRLDSEVAGHLYNQVNNRVADRRSNVADNGRVEFELVDRKPRSRLIELSETPKSSMAMAQPSSRIPSMKFLVRVTLSRIDRSGISRIRRCGAICAWAMAVAMNSRMPLCWSVFAGEVDGKPQRLVAFF